MTKEPVFVFPNDVEVRRVWFRNEWWYQLDDVVMSFVYPENAKEFLLQIRNFDLEFDRWWKTNSRLLLLEEGNSQDHFIDLEGAFRVVQSIPCVSTDS